MSVRGSREGAGDPLPLIYIVPPPSGPPANDNIPAGYRALITRARAALEGRRSPDPRLPDTSCVAQVGQQGFIRLLSCVASEFICDFGILSVYFEKLLTPL